VKVTIDDNVTVLPVKPRPNLGDERVFTTVPIHTCWHKRYIIDDKLAEVTCADCKEKLKPSTDITNSMPDTTTSYNGSASDRARNANTAAR
jgi:hypothetical protein